MLPNTTMALSLTPVQFTQPVARHPGWTLLCAQAVCQTVCHHDDQLLPAAYITKPAAHQLCSDDPTTIPYGTTVQPVAQQVVCSHPPAYIHITHRIHPPPLWNIRHSIACKQQPCEHVQQFFDGQYHIKRPKKKTPHPCQSAWVMVPLVQLFTPLPHLDCWPSSFAVLTPLRVVKRFAG